MMDWFARSPELAAVAIALAFAVLYLLFAPQLSNRPGAVVGIGALGCVAAGAPVFLSDSPHALAILSIILLAFVGMLLVPRAVLEREQEHVEVAALFFLSVASAIVFATTDNLMSFVIGLEGLSLSFVVLIAISAGTAAVEAAFKYFILGSVSAAFTIYGVGLYAYSTGSLNLGATAAIEPGLQSPYVLSVVLIALGAVFELALVPLHFGGLGLYMAAPPAFAGYVMCTGKLAAAFALTRLLDASQSTALAEALQVMGIVSIVWGTVGALAQQDLRRMLAYSAIANAGFIGLALGSGEQGRSIAAYYALAYSASAYLVFAAVERLEHGTIALSDLPKLGLSRLSTLCLAVGLLSLAGIPPLPGFWAKVGVLWAAWHHLGPAATWLAALCGVAGVVFYLRPLPALLGTFRWERQPDRGTPLPSLVALLLAGAAVLAFTVAPQLVATIVEAARR